MCSAHISFYISQLNFRKYFSEKSDWNLFWFQWLIQSGRSIVLQKKHVFLELWTNLVSRNHISCKCKMFYLSLAQDTLTTTFALLGKGTASMSFTMAYIVSAEVYPTEVRNWGMGTSSVCARISGMAAPYIGDALVCKFHYFNQFKFKWYWFENKSDIFICLWVLRIVVWLFLFQYICT